MVHIQKKSTQTWESDRTGGASPPTVTGIALTPVSASVK